MKRQTARFVGIVAMFLAAFCVGCSSEQRGNWVGPRAAAAVRVEPWRSPSYSGKIITTAHYQIFTTGTGADFIARMPQVMEGAWQQYNRFAPATSGKSELLKCYVFEKREQFLQFTRVLTSTQSDVYTQIQRGGYTFEDVFVAYFTGEDSIYSIASHEGWHQYVSRHFIGRLPPFLEEGVACMFENVRYKGKLPRWELSLNPNRALGLRNSIDAKDLWPLETLITMHAGDIVRLPWDRVQSFYAQDWAFARFLWEGSGGGYRPAFQKLLADTAGGDPFDPSNTLRSASGLWAPRTVKPVLEHYLGKDLAAIDQEYQLFIRKIAFEEFNKQWLSNP